MIIHADSNTRVEIIPTSVRQDLYFTVTVSSTTSLRIKTSFTVTKGELEALITALVMLKDELDKRI